MARHCAWKRTNKRLMDERDALMTAEQLEQRRIEPDDPNCWMCGGDGECDRRMRGHLRRQLPLS